MDYNETYTRFFNNTINRTEKKILVFVKGSKKKNKNFLSISDDIKNQLGKKEKQFQDSLLKDYPKLYKSFKNRFRDYDSDFRASFFEHELVNKSELPASILRRFVAVSAIYEGLSLAVENFSMSDEFLKIAYSLDKNYEYYTLNFSQNENPIYSKLFNEMKKERYPGFGDETNWESMASPEILKGVDEPNLAENGKEAITNKQTGNQEKIKDRKQQITLPDFEKDEKILLIHYLFSISDISNVEKAKIIYLIGEVVDGKSLFQEVARKNIYYNKIRQGAEYYGKIRSKALLESVLKKIKHLGLSNLTIALKLAQINLNNETIKKERDK